MTALCGGGDSQTLSGVSAAIILTTTAVEAFLTPLIDPTAATIIAGVIAASLSIDSNAYCATDPPSDPGIVASDLLDIINYTDPAAMNAAVSKFEQWFLSRYWFQVCKCSSTATPAPPTLSNPGGASQSPGLPTANNTDPCWNVTVATTVAGAATHGDATYATPVGLVPGVSAGNYSHGTPTQLTPYYAIPPGANNVKWSTSVDTLASNAFGNDAVLTFLSSTGAFVSNGFIGQPFDATDTTNPVSGTLAIPGTAVYWAPYIVNNGDLAPRTFTTSLTFYCSGNGPAGLAVPCCPPDPLLQGILSQILGLVTGIYESLPVPLTSYADATIHSGLSGSGEIATGPGCLALRVDLTTIPSSMGRVVGDPTFYFSLGWITPLIVSTPYASTALSFDPQQIVLPQLVDSFAYTLHAGVVATVTELIRGP